MTFNIRRVIFWTLALSVGWLLLLTIFNLLAAGGAFAHVPWIDGLA